MSYGTKSALWAGERAVATAAASTFATCELQLVRACRIVFINSTVTGDLRIAHTDTALLSAHAAPAFGNGAQNLIRFGADTAAVTGILLLPDTLINGTFPWGQPIALPKGGFLQIQDDTVNVTATFTVVWIE